MAQSEKLKQMHKEMVSAAAAVFEEYKTFIATEFVNTFGRSYETTWSLPTDWRKYYTYKPQCEQFLIDKTKTFIHIRTPLEDKYQSPVFLKTLTGLISEYLATYTVQKGWPLNDCKKYLRTQLFDNNRHIQLQIWQYTKRNERAWGLKQKRRRQEQQKAKAIKCTPANPANAKPLILSDKEEGKLHKKALRRQIIEKKKELGLPIEYDYNLTMKQIALMNRKYETNIKIFVSINANTRKR